MVIIQIAGGLGNQLQQYSVYRKFLKLGKEAKLDLSWFEMTSQKGLFAPRKLELGKLNLPFDVCTQEEKRRFTQRSGMKKVFEKLAICESSIFVESQMYHENLFELDDKYISGYFACEKYYDDIMPQLRKMVVFPQHHNIDAEARNVDIMNEMEERPSVSIHVRRGDYLSSENAAVLGGIATDAYYDKASEYFCSKNSNTHFYVFSDDSEYAKEKYYDTNRYTVIDWNNNDDSMLDIELMSHCMGNICANSTFSFWGARLNKREDHEVIRTYTMRNNQPCNPTLMHEYWKGWILIDKDGKII